MNNPVHKIKRYVTYADGREPHWTEDNVVGWLTTGLKDKNGVEIYEGDKVKVFDDGIEVVNLIKGVFKLGKYIAVNDIPKGELEVVEHIAEENES